MTNPTNPSDETPQEPLSVSKERLTMLRAKLLDMHLAWMKQGAELLQYHVRLRILEEQTEALEKGHRPPEKVQ